MQKTILVRDAVDSDYQLVSEAVTDLLRDLSGNKDRVLVDARQNFEALIADEEHGGVLVAEQAEGEFAGVLTYSFAIALRAGGEYCTIQELWVHPDFRSQSVGSMLTKALVKKLRGRCSRIEVGLPGESYPETARTERFYESTGFSAIGKRMFKLV